MARIDRSKKPDPQVQQVLDVLAEYESKHPNALIEARRTAYDFIHIRIIDPDFKSIERRMLRKDKVWPIVYKLPDEIVSSITRLIVVTPEEAPHSGSSIEFDHPLPPLPIPDFSKDGVKAWENGYATNGGSANGEAILVPLETQEVDAVKELAQSEGISDGDLVRGWVLEKLQLANTKV